ncbi:MAG: acyltransferase [Clostridia bacterium]|nr:acyltransferase [Clostridia bacterium]
MGNNVNKKEDTSYITLLSVISAIAVVMIHVNAACLGNVGAENRYWFGAIVIDCISCSAVPIFFMISGANLIDYRERYSTKEYFIKRIKKTVIPYIVWTSVSTVYFVLTKRNGVTEISLRYLIERFIDPTWVYWFFAPLFIAYCIIPLLSLVPKEKRKSIFLYLALLSFISNSLIPFLQNNVYFFSFKTPFSVGGEFTFYILAGYWLCNFKLDRKKEIAVYITAVIGLLLYIIGTYRLSVNAGKLTDSFRGFNNVPCVLYSVGIFVLFRNYGNKLMSKFINKPVNFMSKYTFGIYLIHMYFVETIFRLIEYLSTENINTIANSPLYRLAAVIRIPLLCIPIIFLLRKIPVVRHIVP